jgi:hypothetical protein
MMWRARLSGPLAEAPVLTPETAYQYCADDGLVAVSIRAESDDTRIRWKFSRGRRFLTLDEQRVFVLTSDGQIAVLAAADGHVLQEIPAQGFTMAAAVVDIPAFYLIDPQGRVLCARAKDVPFPRREAVVKALVPEKSAEEAAAGAAEETSLLRATPEIPLESANTGKPVGGKSKISKEWTPPATTQKTEEQPK